MIGGYFGDFYPADVFLGKFKAIQRSSKDHSIQEKDLIKEALTPKKKKDTRYVLLLTKVVFCSKYIVLHHFIPEQCSIEHFANATDTWIQEI
jgi:hypothetical protein